MLPLRKSIFISTTFALTLLLAASPAKACLNDRHTEAAEAEFRSRYESPPPEISTRPTILGFDLWGVLATVAGSALCTYAVIATLKRKP